MSVASVALFGSRRSRRLVERNVMVYRRGWMYFVSGFFEPFLYLLSIGVGLNKLVGTLVVSGRPIAYTAYVAPGLLAASAMNGAIFDSTFQVFFKLKIAKTYDAILSTPLTPNDVALGELSWSVMRGSTYSAAFLVVMAGFGYVVSPWAALAFPAAILVSTAFAAAGMTATSFMRSWQDFDKISLAIIPLFLFSATFYPLSVYPGWLQLLVRASPLYQGVALLRGLDTGALSLSLAGHALYLAAMGFVGLVVTSRRLGTLLLP